MLWAGLHIMTRASSSILCGLFLLTAGYFGPTDSAQACSCLEPDITREYADADRVFHGTVIWALELGQRNYFLVQPKHAYKGCLDLNNWEWISTAGNSAACGENFRFGEDYLFFTDTNRRISWTQNTSSCHGNRVFSSLTKEDKSFLDSRYNCCGDDCGCGDGSEPVNCLVDPCELALPCESDQSLTCVSNYCGGCNAEFVDKNGHLACQPNQGCTLDRDCQEGEYCGAQGECVDVGSCSADYECNLPGNNFNHSKRCLGYGECKENRCEYTCGNAQCINHEGYDFGDCEMVIGYVRIGDTCESVSGCGSLIPGGTSAFATKEACEASCLLTDAAFGCGNALACDLGSEFCLKTLPGVAPDIGTEPRITYECQPFDVPCTGTPTCESCIKRGPFGAFECEDRGNGALEVTVAMP